MLATLALAAPRRVAVDALVESVWGDTPPRTAAKTLQTYVMRLRQLLPQGVLLTVAGGYALNIQPDQIDARRFERLVGSGHDAMAAGDPARAIVALREALSLWRDDPLTDIAATNATRVVRFQEMAAAAQDALFDARLATGDHAALVPLLEEAVGEQPLREHRWVQLIDALHRCGRTADALRAYQRARAVLVDDLGLEPGPELRAAEQAVLAGDPDPAPRTATAVATPVDVDEPTALPAPLTTAAATPWVGRTETLEATIDVVRSGLAGATVSSPRLVTVTGDPGIGKTRLAAAVAAAVSSTGATVLYGRCDEGAAMPYQPFVDAGLTPVSGAGVLSEAAARTLDGVAQFLMAASARRPVLLVLDDLHWADQATASVIAHLSRAMQEHPIVILGVARSGELGPDHPATTALDQLGRIVGSHQLLLGPLDDHAMAGLVAAIAGDDLPVTVIDAVIERAEGNPLFARELALNLADRSVRPSVPPTIRAVVVHRYRRLGAAARSLLGPAVVHDGLFLFETVRDVAGLDEGVALDAIDELLESRVVDPGPRADMYKVSHDLVREVLYADLSSSRRLRLHRRVAVALSEAGPNALPAEVARHYLLSRELPGASAGAAFALTAATFALRSGAFNESIEQLHIALELADDPSTERDDALTELPVALAFATRWAEVVPALTQAAHRIGTTDPMRVASLALDVANAAIGMGNTDLSWTVARIGLDHVGDERNLVWAELRSLELESIDALDPDHPGVPVDHPDRHLAATIVAADSPTPWHSELVTSGASGRAELLDHANRFPGVAAFWCGEYVSSRRRMEQLAEAALADGQQSWASSCLANAARCRIAVGEFGAARALLDRAHAMGDRLGSAAPHHHNLLAADDELSSAIGDGWPAMKAAGGAALLDTAEPTNRSALAAFFAAAARIFAHDPDLVEESLGFASAVVPFLAVAPGWAINYSRMACDVAEALWYLDRQDDIDVIERSLRDKVIAPDFRYPMVDGQHALGRLLGVRRDLDGALDAFAAARDRLADQRARPLHAIVGFDEALLMARIGLTDEAADRFAESGRRFTELGMTGWLDRALEASRRLCHTPLSS
ncbi:MAG: transcriptional regulator, putative ATPase, winged helix family [Ilumatobacteraceae bacterium]|nr:transcriptional regulator, putative ATPase, winged helix family [Ilumatobacteraceae bacterium]